MGKITRKMLRGKELILARVVRQKTNPAHTPYYVIADPAHFFAFPLFPEKGRIAWINHHMIKRKEVWTTTAERTLSFVKETWMLNTCETADDSDNAILSQALLLRQNS